jgi:Flp pilus assembly protein TadG
MPARRRRQRGQSLVEFAFTVPVLLLLVLGTVDLGRGFYLAIEIDSAARQGMRSAIVSDTTDIGDAVRSEPNSAIPNSAATWGSTFAGAAYGCTPNTSANCGDTGGCDPSVFTGGRLACFAIRTCTLTGTNGSPDLGTCSSYGSWGTRPVPVNGVGPHGIQILVVYRLATVTPILGLVTSATGKDLYIRTTVTGNELYF